MKTMIALLAATAVVAGATAAAATEFQASDEARDYELSHSVGSGFGGAYNSVGTPRGMRTWSAPSQTDFQAGGNN